ncbi:MAG: hypothetical protein HQK54_07280 [Oligoflexales bacterium]|nr:hypothetical protein [Oligoflexales bacterium]
MKASILTMFLVGAVQTLVSPKIFTMLVARIRTTGDRGCTGLTDEPTSYALACCFLIILVTLLEKKKNQIFIYSFLLSFQIILFAKSFLGLMILGVMALLYLSVIRKNRIIPILLVALAISISSINTKFNGSPYRIVNLTVSLLQNPRLLISADPSGIDRYAHLVLPAYGFMDKYGLPGGFEGWREYSLWKTAQDPMFSDRMEYITTTRIMNFYGSIMYQLGFVGLLIPLTLSYMIFKIYYKETRTMIFYLLLINLIFINTIPLTSTYAGLLIGVLMYKYSNSHISTSTG